VATYQLVYDMCEYRKKPPEHLVLKARARLLNALFFFSHSIYNICIYVHDFFSVSFRIITTTVLRRGNPKPYDRYNIPDMWSKHIHTHTHIYILYTGPIDLWPRGRRYAATTTNRPRFICQSLLYIDSD